MPQHQIRWDDRWLLTAGGRFDYVETHNISEAKSKNEKQYDDNLSLRQPDVPGRQRSLPLLRLCGNPSKCCRG